MKKLSFYDQPSFVDFFHPETGSLNMLYLQPFSISILFNDHSINKKPSPIGYHQIDGYQDVCNDDDMTSSCRKFKSFFIEQ